MAKATKAQLIETLEQLGKVRDKLGKIKATEADLAKTLREQMASTDAESCQSPHYTAQLAARTSLTIDPAKFRRKAGEEVFAACAKIDTKAARLHFSDDKLAKLGKVRTTTTLRVSVRP